MPNTLRSTQRAPTACKTCSKRRVKCNRRIPCDQCISRGIHDTCQREAVLVRGVETIAHAVATPSYNELVRQNQELKFSLSQNIASESCSKEWLPNAWDDCEKQLFSGLHSLAKQTDVSWPDLLLPSRALSSRLLLHDKLWNSWVHYGIDHPRFEHEHDSFWDALEEGRDLQSCGDPSWLSVYFAVLTTSLLSIGSDEVADISLPREDEDEVARIWYATSLMCLDRADFMRSYNVRTIQTIVILGMCFLNFGDMDLQRVLWSCAIRIAQNLGLNQQNVPEQVLLDHELCHRMWWTLIIVEWLTELDHYPCVTGQDFDVPMPTLGPEAAMPLQRNRWNCYPVQYHIVMIRISGVFQRFRTLLRSGKDLVDAVQDVDNHFAGIIEDLPPHLQPDEIQDSSTRERDEQYPWIRWQHADLRLVLLYHRLSINRLLQRQWVEAPVGSLSGPRSVCLSSALGILAVTKNWNLPMARRRQWAVSAHLYGAAVCLIAESRTRFETEINHAIDCLEHVQSKNAIAKRAVQILNGLMYGHMTPSDD